MVPPSVQNYVNDHLTEVCNADRWAIVTYTLNDLGDMQCRALQFFMPTTLECSTIHEQMAKSCYEALKSSSILGTKERGPILPPGAEAALAMVRRGNS